MLHCDNVIVLNMELLYDNACQSGIIQLGCLCVCVWMSVNDTQQCLHALTLFGNVIRSIRTFKSFSSH